MGSVNVSYHLTIRDPANNNVLFDGYFGVNRFSYIDEETGETLLSETVLILQENSMSGPNILQEEVGFNPVNNTFIGYLRFMSTFLTSYFNEPDNEWFIRQTFFPTINYIQSSEGETNYLVNVTIEEVVVPPPAPPVVPTVARVIRRSPKVTITTQQGNSNNAPLGGASEIPLGRFMIREMFPNSSKFNGEFVQSRRWAQTPFRVAMNAGDLLSRQTEPGGSNQVKGIPGRRALLFGSGGTASGNGATGNQHYVYDSSVYTKYKNISAKAKNYDDISFGGANNGAYVFSLAGRRFTNAM
jgi:hypothetical protein